MIFRLAGEALAGLVVINQMEVPILVVVRVVRRMHDRHVGQVPFLELLSHAAQDPDAPLVVRFMGQLANHAELDTATTRVFENDAGLLVFLLFPSFTFLGGFLALLTLGRSPPVPHHQTAHGLVAVGLDADLEIRVCLGQSFLDRFGAGGVGENARPHVEIGVHAYTHGVCARLLFMFLDEAPELAAFCCAFGDVGIQNRDAVRADGERFLTLDIDAASLGLTECFFDLVSLDF